MKLVKENINFERGLDPKDAMGTGLWQAYKDIIVSLEEFKENGGILEKGRAIWGEASGYKKGSKEIKGYWLEWDKNQNIDLMYNDRFKSTHVPPDAGVKVPAKVMYK